MKTMVMFVAALVALAGVASAGVLWTEDFQGYVKDDAQQLPDQDATWSLVPGTDCTAHAIIQDETFWGDTFIPAGEKVLQVDSVSPSSGHRQSWAYKDLTGLGAVESLVTVSVVMNPGWNYDSWFSGMSAFKVDDMAHLEYWSYPGGGTFRLNGVDLGARVTAAWTTYVFDLDFDADTVALTIEGEGSPRATVAMGADYAPGDLDQLGFAAGIYYKAGRTGYTWFDDIEISEIPEPMTMSLLAIGGLAVIRRRK